MFFHTANSPPALCTPAYALSLAVLNVHTGARKRVWRGPEWAQRTQKRAKTCVVSTGEGRCPVAAGHDEGKCRA